MKQRDIFLACRNMDAASVALVHGMPLKQRGNRSWMPCIFHEERTPSLCFFPDGRWYCFSCHAHGDAVAMQAALENVTLKEAARQLASMERCIPRAKELPHMPRPEDPRLIPSELGYDWSMLCSIRHQADEDMVQAENEGKLDVLWQALLIRSTAETELENMEIGGMKE